VSPFCHQLLAVEAQLLKGKSKHVDRPPGPGSTLGVVAAVLTMVPAQAAYAAPPGAQPLDRVDIGSETIDELDHDVTMPEWGPSEPSSNPGNWGRIGSEPGQCRVVWYSADPADDPWAELTLDTGGAKGRHIKMRVLDGIADDSFNVYVKNPGGNWALVYSYSDESNTEVWKVHDIYSFPAGKGQGAAVEIKIEATGLAWSGFSTYGQLAVDWVEVWDH